MATFTKGNTVTGKTVRGNPISGTVQEVKTTKKGEWITVDIGNGKTASTRPSLLKLV